MAVDIIPLVTDNQGNYNLNTDEDITIMYHNVSPIKTGTNDYSLTVRPSLGTVTSTASIDDASRGRGIAEFKGYDLMLVNDDTWYYSAGSTEIHIATPFDKESLAKFTLYSQAGADRLVLVNAGAVSEAGTTDGSIWFMVDTTTAPTEIADADAPGYNGNSLCRGGVSLDGYFFVGDILGNIVNSDLDDLTSWTSTSLVVAEREADTGVYIGKHRDHVFFMGTRSLEFFYNAANTAPASPLTRRADLFHSVGCYHPNTVLELGDNTFFIGLDSEGKAALWLLENFNVQPIGSHPIMDKLIRGLEYAEPDITGATDLQQDVYLASFNSADTGQFLVLTMPLVGSFALHLETNTWSRWYLGGTPTAANGGIADWEDPKIFPLTASLNRPGSNSDEPNRFMLLNAMVSSETIITGTSQDFVYTGATFDTSAQVGGSPLSRMIDFSIDGTKMYVSTDGPTTGFIYEYDLSPAFDITSSVYSGNSFDTFNENTSNFGIHISPDGTKVFIVGGAAIFQYTLGTAFDISTAVYDNLTFDISPESASNGRGSTTSPDGLTFWACGLTTDSIWEYTMTSPFDLSTISYSGNTLTVVPEAIEPEDIAFNNVGTEMYIQERSTQQIFTYDLSTAYDITTATFTAGNIIDTSSQHAAGTVGGITQLNGAIFTMDVTTDDIFQWGNLAVDPLEFGGGLAGVDNPDFIAYSKPWDLDTDERKRISVTRVLHYAEGKTGITSLFGIDWIDLENITAAGIDPTTFGGVIDVDLASYTARLYRCGNTRQRIFKVVFNGAKTQIVKGLEIEYSLLRG